MAKPKRPVEPKPIEPYARERVLAQGFFRSVKPGENWSEALTRLLAEYREEVRRG